MKALSALFPYLQRYRHALIMGVAFIVINNLLATLPAQLVRHAIDHYQTPQHSIFELFEWWAIPFPSFTTGTELLLTVIGLMMGIMILRGMVMYGMRQAVIRTSRRIEADLRADLFRHLLNLPMEQFHRHRTGDFMARLTEDLSRIRMVLGPGLLYGVNLIIMISVIVSTIFFINVELAWYVVSPLPPMAWAVYRVSRVIYIRSEQIQALLSHLTSFVQESFAGIRIIKAFASERVLNQRFEAINRSYRDHYLHYVRADALFFPAMLLFMGLSMLFVLYIGGQKVMEGTITLGNLAELFVYLNMLMWPVASIGWITTLAQRAAASQSRINELLNTHNPLIRTTLKQGPVALTNVQGRIRSENVAFTYTPLNKWRLHHIDFELFPGKKLGLVGRTGSGKSTLIQLLGRFYDPSEGVIQIDSIPYPHILPRHLRQRVIIVYQESFLFSESIGENLIRGLPEPIDWHDPEQRIQVLPTLEKVTRQAAIYDDIQRMPKGFDTLLGERGVNLSGGQKQRLCLARALLRDAPVYILDDALSAVDAHTETIILRNLRQALQGKTLIMSTHRISQIIDADEILVLSKGQIIARGTHQQLLAACTYYAHVYQRQMQITPPLS